ncbi:transketolase [Patescibacteria group bacterium AH-259-L07]|nr:transketolase [Patescibacteria group bacterium AH-259-L07]
MSKIDLKNLEKIAKLIRYWSLTSTTEAGSGHPTSSLSAVELMAGLMFGGIFRFDKDNPNYPNNDRLIFSKGHASPLFYALWAATGVLDEKELMTLRQFGSSLEGHPTPLFPYTEAATGSLGQGLSIGAGMALNAKYLDKLPYKTYVLLGDSEMSEGSQWEAIQLAYHYKLDNLIGILDVNRLGQRGETMYGHNIDEHEKRIKAFGWKTITIDGHSFKQVISAYKKATDVKDRPTMIITKTVKGKGISILEDKNGWHGKPLNREELKKALKELGEIDKSIRGIIAKPGQKESEKPNYPTASVCLPSGECVEVQRFEFSKVKPLATRKAYGMALVNIYPQYQNIVSLDAEVSNSTYSEIFQKYYPKQFFEMFIAEQNMIGVALGLAARGKIPFVSTFAAFLTRAFDQIRMSQYSYERANIKFVGSHAGVSIGQDGPSQMGLEDIAMFRSLINSVVLYPSDAISTEKLVEAAAKHKGIVYIRTTRPATLIIYDTSEAFPIGGSKVIKQSSKDRATVVAAGITLYEALAAYEELKKQNIYIRIIDCYSIKPIDISTLTKAAQETKYIITVEDHVGEGGLGEAVKSALSSTGAKVYSLAVDKIPHSGSRQELFDFEGISCDAIIKKIKKLL